MAVRASLPAFHPDAAMQCLSGRQSDRVILQRGDGVSKLWAVHNVTANRINLDLRTLANRSQWCDRLRDQADVPTRLTLAPFAVHWLQPC